MFKRSKLLKSLFIVFILIFIGLFYKSWLELLKFPQENSDSAKLHVLDVHYDHDVQVPSEPSEKHLFKSLVIASAISSNHFNESMDLLGSLHHFVPNNIIYMYNLGLKEEEIDFLNGLKNVYVVNYNFTANPAFRENKGLACYSWKIHILYELAKKHKVIAWFDASVRINKPLTHNGCIKTLNDFPLSACSPHLRPMIEFATDSMLDYLKIKREDKMRQLYGFEANCMMFKVTEKLLPLLDRVRDCALHRECICGGRVDNWYRCKQLLREKPPLGIEYIDGCHRFDQAAMTLIASQLYGIDKVNQRVTPNCSGVFSIQRRVTNRYQQYLVKKQQGHY